jgi:hypothetical protein
MASEEQRKSLFWGVCLPLRIALTAGAKFANQEQLRVMGIIAFIPAMLFIIVWATGTRNDKGAFGGPVWWSQSRIIHGILILLFALNASVGNVDAWKWLAVDTGFGALNFTNHYYIK